MKSIKGKILFNTTIVIVCVVTAITSVWLFSMKSSINSILLDTLQPMVKIACQSIEGNLHMLSDRIFSIADENTLSNTSSTKAEKQKVLEKAEAGIEFVWLALYDKDGRLYTGNSKSPNSIADRNIFKSIKETENLVIDNTSVTENGLEIAIGAPVFDSSKNINYFLIGAYKYDVLNDVLSNINIGHYGTAFIINNDGLIVSHKDTSFIKDKVNVFDKYADNKEFISIFNRMIAGEMGSEDLNIEKRPNFTAFAPVRGTNWSLIIHAPQSDFMEKVNTAIILNSLLVIILLLLSLSYTAKFAIKISKSLTNITKRIEGLANGDITNTVEIIKTKDEAERLSTSLMNTISSLNTYMCDLKNVISSISNGNLDITVSDNFKGDFIVMKESLNNIVNFLNKIIRELQESSKTLYATANMVSQNSHFVHESSVNQSNSVEGLVKDTKIISENISEVEENANNAKSLVNQAISKLDIGKISVKSMVNIMHEISKNAIEINKINKFLEDISFQTNILAINAAIEASSAGINGKGFSVVAEQVRSLALESAEASKKSTEILDYSQHTIEQGSKFADEVAIYMDEIINISNHISLITDNLAESVSIEKQSLENVTSEIESISKLARQNLEASRESSLVSEELSRQSNSLNEMTSNFILKNINNKKGD